MPAVLRPLKDVNILFVVTRQIPNNNNCLTNMKLSSDIYEFNNYWILERIDIFFSKRYKIMSKKQR